MGGITRYKCYQTLFYYFILKAGTRVYIYLYGIAHGVLILKIKLPSMSSITQDYLYLLQGLLIMLSVKISML